jgi:replicative DNA helicase
MQPPPHDLAAEEVVLSAVLWSDRTAHELGLLPRQFWAVEHQQIWAVQLAAEELLGDDLAPDTRAWTVTRVQLPWAPVPESRLREILCRVPVFGRPEHYAARVRELHHQRQLIEGMQRVDAALRAGERPSARLLRWTARRLEQMAVDGASHD